MKIIVSEKERVAIRDYMIRVVDMLPDEERINALMDMFNEPMFDMVSKNGGVITIPEKYIVKPLEEADKFICEIKPEMVDFVNEYGKLTDEEKIAFMTDLKGVTEPVIEKCLFELGNNIAKLCKSNAKMMLISIKAKMLVNKIKHVLNKPKEVVWNITKVTIHK